MVRQDPRGGPDQTEGPYRRKQRIEWSDTEHLCIAVKAQREEQDINGGIAGLTYKLDSSIEMAKLLSSRPSHERQLYPAYDMVGELVEQDYYNTTQA